MDITVKNELISGIACALLLLTLSACSTGSNGDTSPSVSPSESSEPENTETPVSEDEDTSFEDYSLTEALDEYPDEENLELGIIIMDSLLADPEQFVKAFAQTETHELVYLLIGTTVAENLQYGDTAYLDAANSVDTSNLNDSEKEVYQYILDNIENAKTELGFDS